MDVNPHLDDWPIVHFFLHPRDGKIWKGEDDRCRVCSACAWDRCLLADNRERQCGESAVASHISHLLCAETIDGLRTGVLRERTRTWDLAVCAYLLMVLTIVLDWKEGSLLMLVHPVVNGLMGKGSVALTIRLTRGRTSTPHIAITQ